MFFWKGEAASASIVRVQPQDTAILVFTLAEMTLPEAIKLTETQLSMSGSTELVRNNLSLRVVSALA